MPPAPLLLQFSNVDDPTRLRLLAALASLRCTAFVDSPRVAPGISHLIMATLTNNVKLQGACAAGAWVLRPAYVFDSASQGRWLPEEEFEWTAGPSHAADKRVCGPADAPQTPSRHFVLAELPQRWRLATPRGAFAGWSVVWLIDDHAEGNLQRFLDLLLAGGAIVLCTMNPLEEHDADALDIIAARLNAITESGAGVAVAMASRLSLTSSALHRLGVTVVRPQIASCQITRRARVTLTEEKYLVHGFSQLTSPSVRRFMDSQPTLASWSQQPAFAPKQLCLPVPPLQKNTAEKTQPPRLFPLTLCAFLDTTLAASWENNEFLFSVLHLIASHSSPFCAVPPAYLSFLFMVSLPKCDNEPLAVAIQTLLLNSVTDTPLWLVAKPPAFKTDFLEQHWARLPSPLDFLMTSVRKLCSVDTTRPRRLVCRAILETLLAMLEAAKHPLLAVEVLLDGERCWSGVADIATRVTMCEEPVVTTLLGRLVCRLQMILSEKYGDGLHPILDVLRPLPSALQLRFFQSLGSAPVALPLAALLLSDLHNIPVLSSFLLAHESADSKLAEMPTSIIDAFAKAVAQFNSAKKFAAFVNLLAVLVQRMRRPRILTPVVALVAAKAAASDWTSTPPGSTDADEHSQSPHIAAATNAAVQLLKFAVVL